jgi:hypothetical protein
MKKILLFHYFGGAGGKFIANCLGFSEKVAFPNFKIAIDVLTHQDRKLVEQKLLDTIPKKENSRQWLQYEQGCKNLFGNDIVHIANGTYKPKYELNNLTELGPIWLPLVSTDLVHFNNYRRYFSNDQIFTVLVDSDKEFIDLAIRKKWPGENHCLDIDLYKKFRTDFNQLEFDFVFENWNPILIQNHQKIQQLAKKIDCEFDWNLTKNYVKKYIDFHQD